MRLNRFYHVFKNEKNEYHNQIMIIHLGLVKIQKTHNNYSVQNIRNELYLGNDVMLKFKP